MHDDGFDDDWEEDPPEGKLLHSGINPYPQRAEYALPLGEPALQGGEAEFEIEPSRRSRLSTFTVVVASTLTLIGVSAIGVALGWRGDGRVDAASPVPTLLREKVDLNLRDWANSVAVGRVADLIEYRLPFLAVVGMEGDRATPDMWHGVERLAHVALVSGLSERHAMITAILEVAEMESAPGAVRVLLPRLAAAISDGSGRR